MIEGLLTFSLVVFAILINVELVRRTHYEVILQFGSFLLSREQVFGKSEKEVRSATRRQFGSLSSVFDKFHWSLGDLKARGHLRYPTLIKFPFRGYKKHHFEMTHECIFPYSFY